ncbi:MAG: leucyl aminopeptidase [bacterium]|jgi:leucyl aminopeptidase
MKIQIEKRPVSKNFIVFYDRQKKLIVSSQWKKENNALYQQISNFLELPETKALKPSATLFYSSDLNRVLLVGIGKVGKDEVPDYRSIGGIIGKKIKSIKSTIVDMLLPLPTKEKSSIINHIDILLEGILLGSYEFKQFKSQPTETTEENGNDDDSTEEETSSTKKPETFEILNLITEPSKETTVAVEKSQVVADSTNLARDWGNSPANYMTPTEFKVAAQKIAKETKIKVSSLDIIQLKKLGFGCLTAVAQGSEEPAFLHILEYKVRKKNAETILLVGKGLTFDAGGISIKPAAGMDEMKYDMCGGSAVLAAMRIIGHLKPSVNVIALIPSTENLINGKAVKPGDIITAYNGKTVEVLNTDAEGRLILADSIAYGVDKYEPNVIVDVATLTGACMIALGSYHTGLMSNNDDLVKQLTVSGERTGDHVWRLPATESYEKQIKGSYGDIKNTGGREAGAITAGLFLKHFTKNLPWAHLDIAGTAWNVSGVNYYPKKGATGVGARLLADFVMNWKSLEEEK